MRDKIMLFILSWIVTATNPDLKVRSLLSGEGVRWFIGAYVDNQSNFVLVWLLLLSISFGAVRQSGLLSAVRNIRRLGFRERLAIRFVSIELVLFIIVLFLLTCVPHAVLLNVAGNIYPGSLSMGFVALLSFVLCTFAITFGLFRIRHAFGHLFCFIMFCMDIDGAHANIRKYI